MIWGFKKVMLSHSFTGVPVVWAVTISIIYPEVNMLGAVFKGDVSALSFLSVTDHHNIKTLT